MDSNCTHGWSATVVIEGQQLSLFGGGHDSIIIMKAKLALVGLENIVNHSNKVVLCE
jgi:hypothetical protein